MARAKNPKLKKPNIKTEITKEQIQEFARCARDPIYFINNYVYIKHPVKGQILFDMYDYQEDLVNMYEGNRYNIVLSARQTGKTETSCAYLLWFAIFKKKKTILITSNKGAGAMELIAKIQNAYEELPDWLKPGIDENSWNKHECKWDNGSRIVSQATSKDSGRGLSISLVYCDELAFVKPNMANEFWDSILPTLSTGGSCIISSTPNGSTNLFARLWREAKHKINDFASVHIKWDQPPGRDEEFKEQQIGMLGELKWRQEFECEFLSSEATLIDTRYIRKMRDDKVGTEPAMVIDEQVFWKRPNKEATYLIVCDPSEGVGRDYMTINVFEFPTLEQVMEFRSNTMSPMITYSKLKQIVRFYETHGREVYFALESNGVGQGVVSLYEADEDIPQKAAFISEPGKDIFGFKTTQGNKMKACMKFKEMFEGGKIKLYSDDFLDELESYTRHGNTYKAEDGATDDLVSGGILLMRLLEEMSSYDSRAYIKLYGFEEEEDWDISSDDIDSEPLPFGMI